MRARAFDEGITHARSRSPSSVSTVSASNATPKSRGVSDSPRNGKNATRGSIQRTITASATSARTMGIRTNIGRGHRTPPILLAGFQDWTTHAVTAPQEIKRSGDTGVIYFVQKQIAPYLLISC